MEYNDKNLNFDDVKKKLDEWFQVCTEDYMDSENARFQVIYHTDGIFQVVKQ